MFGLVRKKHVRSDISLIESWIGQAMAARSQTGTALTVEELPIAQGLVALIADAIADMELYAVDAPGPKGKRVADTYAVLENPDPDEDRADTLHKIVQSMFWGGANGGNAWALNGPRDARGAVDSITVLNPDEVGWLPTPSHSLKVAGWTVNGVRYPVGALTWWKINDNPRKGPLGRSPIAVAARALDMYGWAYRYLADFFASGGNPSSVMRSKLELAPAKITELSDEWATARQLRRPAFLPSWLELDIPPSSGEIEAVVKVLEFGAAEFARLTNVPVSLVNAPTAGYSLTYTNTSDEFKRWLAVSLGTTWIRRIERGFTTLLPEGRWAKLDPSSLFPAELFAADDPAGAPVDRATPIEATATEVPA
jgi:phage portal protein BeeE